MSLVRAEPLEAQDPDAALREQQAQRDEDCRALRVLNQRREQDIRRIARELHDSACQLLISVRFALEDAERSLGPASARPLDVVRERIDEAERELRRLSHELRPPALDDLGLLPAVRMAADGIARRSGLAIQVRGGAAGRMTSDIETALYRVVQEALVNAARHARADAAEVELDQDGLRVTCRVTDRGVGFDPRRIRPARGLGLIGMRERVAALHGTLVIDSAPGRGTTISVDIPLQRPA